MEVKGKRLGLIGSGNIGGELGRLATAVGMRVEVYDPFVSRSIRHRAGVVLQCRP